MLANFNNNGGASPHNKKEKTMYDLNKIQEYLDNKKVLIYQGSNNRDYKYYIKEIKKQPDIVFFDADDKMMCVIEIHDTNPKTEEDINKFQKLNIPVY
jgi:hypothetical protein